MNDPHAAAARWIRPEIRALRAYHVAHAEGMVKLDSMENPYTWPPELMEAWRERLKEVHVNRYPNARADALRTRLRQVMDIPAEAEVLLGNGSDELIQIVAMALAGPGRVLLSPEPSFAMYSMTATFVGMEHVAVPLRAEDFSLDLAAMRAHFERHRPAVVFLAYPNNPTGNRFDPRQVREILAMAPGLVVVDEAYAPFAAHSFLPEVLEHDNLVVMRTLSKMGLAGLRLGYLVGAGAWLEEFDKVRMPYNVNTLSQVSADFALVHKAVFDEQADRIRAERGRLIGALERMNSVTPYPSEANFVLVRTAPGLADQAFEGLKRRGILVKNLNGSSPALADCLRLTVGSAEENDAVLAALSEALAG